MKRNYSCGTIIAYRSIQTLEKDTVRGEAIGRWQEAPKAYYQEPLSLNSRGTNPSIIPFIDWHLGHPIILEAIVMIPFTRRKDNLEADDSSLIGHGSGIPDD